MRIDKLTDSQEKQLIDFREKYLGLGLSTQPINKEKSKEIIKEIYKEYLGLDNPYVWYCESPLQAQLIINILKLEANSGYNLEASLKANLLENLGTNLRDNLVANLWANLGSSL